MISTYSTTIVILLTCSSIIHETNCYKICSPTNYKRQNNSVLHDSITINVYDCTDTIIPHNETCTMVKHNVYLPKDKEVDIDYNIYGYPVVAKFFGRNLCAAFPTIYRDSTDLKTTNNSNIYCRRKCEDVLIREYPNGVGSGFDDRDGTVFAGYERMRKCKTYEDGHGCITSSSKYLILVKTTNSNGSHASSINSSKEFSFITLMMLLIMFFIYTS